MQFYKLFRNAPFCILFGFATVVVGQDLDGRIEGTVKDKSGKELRGVNLVLHGTTIGAASNEDGSFSVHPVPPGRYDLIISMVGYQEKRLPVIARAGESIELSITMTESVIELGEVQVVGDIKRQRIEDTRASLLNMEPLSSKTLPGFGEDVLRSLQALPGVISPSDFSSQLIIRGSGPDQNLIIMDGIEVFNPYRLYGLISMFNPETVSDISLITGGFPAKYGDRLSAVLDVTNKEGTKHSGIEGSVNASITNANLITEGGAPFGLDGSYLFSARRTYYDLFAGPIAKSAGLVEEDVAFPNFSDLQAKIALGPFNSHKIILNGLKSRDGFDIVTGSNNPSPDSINAFNQTNHAVLGLSYTYAPSSRVFAKTSLSYYLNDGYSDFGGSFLDPSIDREKFMKGAPDTLGVQFFDVSAVSKYEFRKTSFKGEFFWKEGNHTVEAGLGVDKMKTLLSWDILIDKDLRAFFSARGGNFIDKLRSNYPSLKVHGYLQDRIAINPHFYVNTGLRLDYYDLLQKFYLAPRLSVSYGINALTTFRGALGVFYQSPGYEKLVDQRRQSFKELDKESASQLNAERAIHYVFGFDRWLDQDLQIRVDLYYKDFEDLIVPVITQGTRYVSYLIQGKDPSKKESWVKPFPVSSDSITSIPINEATGNAYGIELMLEKKRKSKDDRFFGWISYSLAWANRNEYGRILPFDYDQRHTVNIVGNVKILDWMDLGFHWKYGSNFPYTPAIAVQPRIVPVENGGTVEYVVQTDLKGKVVLDIDRGGKENDNSARKPAYHRLDLRATAYTDLWGLNWSFYLDIINVYNRKNVLNYQYYAKSNLQLRVVTTNMFPILPTFGLSVNF